MEKMICDVCKQPLSIVMDNSAELTVPILAGDKKTVVGKCGNCGAELEITVSSPL